MYHIFLIYILVLINVKPAAASNVQNNQPTIYPVVGIEFPAHKPQLCKGNEAVFKWAKFNEVGPRLSDLKKGTPCFVADFNGDKISDYVLIGGEGFVTLVIGRGKQGFEK